MVNFDVELCQWSCDGGIDGVVYIVVNEVF